MYTEECENGTQNNNKIKLIKLVKRPQKIIDWSFKQIIRKKKEERRKKQTARRPLNPPQSTTTRGGRESRPIRATNTQTLLGQRNICVHENLERGGGSDGNMHSKRPVQYDRANLDATEPTVFTPPPPIDSRSKKRVKKIQEGGCKPNKEVVK